MSSTFRQWKNRLQRSTKRNADQHHSSIDNESKTDSDIRDILLNENHLLKIRIDKLEERYQQWIDDEQMYLLKRIEKLENENRQLHQVYQTYQIQNETCIRSITDLIMKIIGTQQELRKQRTERRSEDDGIQRKKRHSLIETDTQSASCRSSAHQMDENRHATNDQTTWLHHRLMNDEEQDQQTTNHSLELINQSLTLATVKPKSDRLSASSTNKLYFALNNGKTTRDCRRLPNANISPVSESNTPAQKKPSTILNKNQSIQPQTRTNHSNHERLPTRTAATTTTTIPKPSRVPTTTARQPMTTVRQRPPAPSTTNAKTITSSSNRPRYTLAKASEPPRSIGATIPTRSIPKPAVANKPSMTVTKAMTNPPKTRIPTAQQSARVSDLDKLMAEQKNKTTPKSSVKPTVIPPTPIVNNLQHSLFSKDSVKIVRPVRSQELKLFSCHLTHIADKTPSHTNDSLSTLTPPSLESITEMKSTENKNNCSTPVDNFGMITRTFSEDSLNEHHDIQKLLQQNISIYATTCNDRPDYLSDDHVQTSSGSDITPITQLKTETSTDSAYCNGSIDQELKEQNTKDEHYFLSTDNNLSSPPSQLSLTTPSKIKSSSRKSLIHRLVFPARLGRMIFHRRILSDSDIYQKICSKDNEIYHNVYHLDTIRDYSMEFYMITTYASDSQLSAWIDSNDDDVVNNVCYFDENRFLIDENGQTPMQKLNSSDSLIEDELDWYSELEILNFSSNHQQDKHETTSSCSSKVHVEELLHAELFSLSSPTTTTSADSFSSTGVTTASWIIPKDPSQQSRTTSVLSTPIDQSDLILREILNHSWTDDLTTTTSNSLQDETNLDQYDNDSTSSLIMDEFQSDFYYLCPVSNTTTFAKTDPKTLFHDV